MALTYRTLGYFSQPTESYYPTFDIVGVTGSIPVAPTIFFNRLGHYLVTVAPASWSFGHQTVITRLRFAPFPVSLIPSP